MEAAEGLELVESLLRIHVRAVACGAMHSLACSSQGEVWAWGNGGSGRLGLGHTAHVVRPAKVPQLASIRALACGDGHSLAVSAQGKLWAFGCNVRNQLGVEEAWQDRCLPTPVCNLEDRHVVAVVAGHAHSACLDSTGALFTWGAGDVGCLAHGGGEDHAAPAQVRQLPSSSRVTALWSGSFHMGVVMGNRDLFAWGLGTSGQLGHGSFATAFVPKRVDLTSAVVSVDGSVAHTLIVTERSGVLACGQVDASHKVPVPTMLPALRGLDVQSVVCGGFQSLARTGPGGNSLLYWDGPPSGEHVELAGPRRMQTLGVSCGGQHVLVVVAKQWLKQSEVSHCMECRLEFGFTQFKHVCRSCRKIVHSSCSSHRKALPEQGFQDPVRVCDSCARAII
ncbi:PH [Durusdinium trenchii]|uniref:RCC1 and FYVE domains-containing protein 1 (Protein Praf4) n=1 Tax=Durusdinium trenchii TaxID=1381693 RepID=A0ABP0KGG6_9DINO